MPMNQFWSFGLVEYVYCDGLALTQPHDRTGGGTVVSGCLDCFSWSGFELDRRDVDRYVSLRVFQSSPQTDTSCQFGVGRCRQQSQEFSALHLRRSLVFQGVIVSACFA